MQANQEAQGELQAIQQKIAEKKAKSQQLKKISNKKDRQLFEMQERVDTADERENALKMRLLDEIQQSNMKGKLLLEMKHQIIELKKYFLQEQMNLQ